MLALDIGGTKVAAGLIDGDGQRLDLARTSTPTGEPRAAVAELCRWLERFVAGRPVAGVGIALPAITRAGRIEWVASTLPGWGEADLASAVAHAVGVPVWCEFDGYAAAWGEAWCGAARDVDSAVVLAIGTGIGAGFLHAGRVLRGDTGVAGTVGWLRFPISGPSGQDTDVLGPPIESYASGAGLLRRARACQPPTAAEFKTTSEVFAAARTGDAAARRALDEATAAIASLVLATMSTFAPQVVVLGGGMGGRPDLVAAVKQLVAGSGHPFSETGTRIVASPLEAPSSLYGAARFAFENL